MSNESVSKQSFILHAPITGREFVEAVRDTAHTYSPREVQVTIGEAYKHGPQLSVVVEFKLGWRVKEKLFFHRYASLFYGEPYFFDAEGQEYYFAASTDPKSKVDSQHNVAIIDWTLIFVEALKRNISERHNLQSQH